MLVLTGCNDDDATVSNAPRSDVHTSQIELVDGNRIGNGILSRGEIRSFEIIQLPWLVCVLQDGSGGIGFGSNLGESLPAGTFDFAKWRNQIVSLQWHDSFDASGPQVNLGVVWHNGVREAYYVDRDKIPIELFQAAVDASTDREIRDLWSQKPLK